MANRLHDLRTARSLSVCSLAFKARTGNQTLLAIERYDYTPRAATRQRIANALGVATTDIWPDVEVAEVVEVGSASVSS